MLLVVEAKYLNAFHYPNWVWYKLQLHNIYFYKNAIESHPINTDQV